MKPNNKWPSGQMLIVDDDETICAAINDMLEDTPLGGVCVYSDRTAYAALAMPRAFRGLILDVNLGKGTTGFDVARFARGANPDIPVIFISGAIVHEAAEVFGVAGAGYLQKPFSREDLIGVLDVLFDA